MEVYAVDKAPVRECKREVLAMLHGIVHGGVDLPSGDDGGVCTGAVVAAIFVERVSDYLCLPRVDFLKK